MVMLKNAKIQMIETSEILDAHIQPMTHKTKVETFGNEVEGSEMMFIDDFYDEGTLFLWKNETYRIEKILDYTSPNKRMSHCECCIVQNKRRK